MADFNTALRVASKAHDGQTDYTGEAYINHPIRVSRIVRELGEEYEVVAILHDTVEDTDLEVKDLASYGFKWEVISAVTLLTKERGTSYNEYIKHICESGNKIAYYVKLGDIQDNTAPWRTELLSDELEERLGEKYSKAIDIMEQYLDNY